MRYLDARESVLKDILDCAGITEIKGELGLLYEVSHGPASGEEDPRKFDPELRAQCVWHGTRLNRIASQPARPRSWGETRM